MSSNARGAIGALHPVLFFVFVYGISLFLAFFICRTVYFSLHEEDPAPIEVAHRAAGGQGLASTAMR